MPENSVANHKKILLADDDKDDCFFFKTALEELPVLCSLTIVHDGEALMQLLLQKNYVLPDYLFLDINMPLKNGIECLAEIRRKSKFDRMPVIMFSSAYAPELIERLDKTGAQYYVRKPEDLSQYAKVIFQALHITYKNLVLSNK